MQFKVILKVSDMGAPYPEDITKEEILEDQRQAIQNYFDSLLDHRGEPQQFLKVEGVEFYEEV